jgi:hypothetical protein
VDRGAGKPTQPACRLQARRITVCRYRDAGSCQSGRCCTIHCSLTAPRSRARRAVRRKSRTTAPMIVATAIKATSVRTPITDAPVLRNAGPANGIAASLDESGVHERRSPVHTSRRPVRNRRCACATVRRSPGISAHSLRTRARRRERFVTRSRSVTVNGDDQCATRSPVQLDPRCRAMRASTATILVQNATYAWTGAPMRSATAARSCAILKGFSRCGSRVHQAC